MSHGRRRRGGARRGGERGAEEGGVPRGEGPPGKTARERGQVTESAEQLTDAKVPQTSEEPSGMEGSPKTQRS